MEKKKRTRIATPKNICLPFVNVGQQTYYKVVSSPRAKRQRKAFWYNDYFVEMLPNIEETIKMMDERERFKELREFTEKIKDMSKYDDFRMRFLISAQSNNDCNLAILYMNYHLKKAEYSFIDYDRTYRLHKEWETVDPHRDIYDKPDEKEKDKDPGEAKTAAKPENGAFDPHEDTEPEWVNDLYPMYIDTDWPDCETVLADDNMLDKYSLIYATENRYSFPMQGLDLFGVFIDADDNSLMLPGREAIPEKRKSLIHAGFKTIFIPDCGDDELRVLFAKVIAGMGMTLARDLSFENVRREYGDYLLTEHALLSAARIIKEHKLLYGKPAAPITFRDFVSVFEADAEARIKYSSSARRNKEESPWDELNKLVGVDRIKTEARKMVDSMLLEKRRKELGLPVGQNTKHSLFFGDPGTSKTTVARILARILQYEGLIKNDAFRDLKKSDVVGAYIGHTAKQVDGIFKETAKAGGGVLFFDEAYTYTMKDSTCYDKEAINCIVQNMENYREIMCIFAGYKRQMQEFVEANPGLRSRIGFVFEFSEYDAPSMCKIVSYQAKQQGFKMPKGCEGMLEDYFTKLKRLQGDGWGNGREARKLVENAILELAARLAKQKRAPSKAQVTALELQDIENAIRNSMEREMAFEMNGRKQIGFM